MVEIRWYTRQSDLDVGWGGPPVYEKERVLQFRYMVDTTVRAGGAGTWDNASIARTANLQWSEWRDVPEEVERDLDCP